MTVEPLRGYAASNTWNPTTTMTTTRAFLAAAVLNSKIYVLGGLIVAGF